MTVSEALLRDAAESLTPSYNPPAWIAGRGEGARLWDTEGREYLDFAGGMGVNILGHAHPDVVRAITQQAALLCHTSNALLHTPGIALSRRLTTLTGGGKVFFCNSGTEAVEAALKLARRAFFDRGETRHEFVATHNGFHGRSYGALSVTGQETYRNGFAPLVPGVRFVPYNDVAALRDAVTPETAAVIIEPIQGNGGVVVPSADYLGQVAEICRSRGTLLIVDEIQTGIGRTGAWFAYEHAGIKPDIVCLAKALGGGLPLGAMVARPELGAVFQSGVHGTTFGGNPVACAAGLATLDVIEDAGLLARAQTMGERYREDLQRLKASTKTLVTVRGQGMLIGLELSVPVADVRKRCEARGLLSTAAGARVLRLFPPLVVSDEQLRQSIDILAETLN